jgi:Xaa-Pro aminopeptidase
MKISGRSMCVLGLLIGFAGVAPRAAAQRAGYSREEFVKRRAALMERCPNGLLLFFGDTTGRRAGSNPGAHVRQDSDFYYLTGVEDVNAVLVMAPRTRQSSLFLPKLTAAQIASDGPNLLEDPKAAETAGFSGIFVLSFLDEFIARNGPREGSVLHLQMAPREAYLSFARRSALHYNDQLPLDLHRIQKLKERCPSFEFKDLTAQIDGLRVIKSAEEIEVLRRNGRISAEAVRQAMIATTPGVFEYEIEGAAMGTIIRGGARQASFPPIVASGRNSCTLHYSKNDRKVEGGDVVLMDFGAELDYLAMDITRTWPVSGTFTPDQKEVYRTVLEVQKACLEAYRPGATAEDVAKHVAETMKAKGLDPRGLRGGFGHYVGMSVHDVGPRIERLKEGMVFAIEPALYYPDKSFGVRIEDTVLITATGCEVLTRGVPKEISEIEALLAGRSGNAPRSR